MYKIIFVFSTGGFTASAETELFSLTMSDAVTSFSGRL